jgi:hypothetical protein
VGSAAIEEQVTTGRTAAAIAEGEALALAAIAEEVETPALAAVPAEEGAAARLEVDRTVVEAAVRAGVQAAARAVAVPAREAQVQGVPAAAVPVP